LSRSYQQYGRIGNIDISHTYCVSGDISNFGV